MSMTSGQEQESGLSAPGFNFSLPETNRPSRSPVTLTTICSLIDDIYFPIIHREYYLVDRSQLQTQVPVEQQPLKKRVLLLLTAALAAAHASHLTPSLAMLAQSLRDWVDELLVDALPDHNDSTLQILVMLTIYELIEPSRNLFWHLQGLIWRLAVELGWDYEEGLPTSDRDPDLLSPTPTISTNLRQRLFHVICQLEA
jgi:hypothetical protein